MDAQGEDHVRLAPRDTSRIIVNQLMANARGGGASAHKPPVPIRIGIDKIAAILIKKLGTK